MKLINPRNYKTLLESDLLNKYYNGKGWLMKKLLFNISNKNVYKYKQESMGIINVKELHIIANEQACIFVLNANRQNSFRYDWYIEVFGNIDDLVIEKIYKIMDRIKINSIIAEPYHSENRYLIKKLNARKSVNNWYIVERETNGTIY